MLDMETTTRCRQKGVFPATPFYHDNKILCTGTQATDREAIVREGGPSLQTTNPILVVAHNAPFDVQWLLRNSIEKSPELLWHSLKGLRIWDTALVQYILTGQQLRFPSLNNVAAIHGLGAKGDTLSEAMESGDPDAIEKIPPSELGEYCKQDVILTRKVFDAQLKVLEQCPIYVKLVLASNQCQMALIEMQRNGLHVDWDELERGAKWQRANLADAVDAFELACKHTFPGIDHKWDVGSNRDVSRFLFGGEITTVETVMAGTFKNGNAKTKKEKKVTKISGLGLDPSAVGAEPNSLGYSVDDEVLERLKVTCPVYTRVIDNIQLARKVAKDLHTYYDAYPNFKMSDGRIHPNYNQTATVTGRLSSSAPNMQNVSSKETSDIKRVFTSRFGKHGLLYEFDYKQLEIVVLAYITGCKQLKADIQDGVDIHSALFEQMYGRMPSPEERRTFKRRTFALVYGAGAKSIAAQADCSVMDAKMFITTWQKRYPETMEYRKGMASHLELIKTHKEHKDGVQIFKASWYTPSGRRLVFNTYPSKYNPGESTFSPTEIANYPIQSFAADIVQASLARLYNWWINQPKEIRDNMLLVNTVHDSVLLDIDGSKISMKDMAEVHNILSDVAGTLEMFYGLNDFDVPSIVEAASGPNWADLVTVKL